ncbi:MAG: CAP domain-containing protein, partial [Lachnospiraceae bacterium]
MKKKVYLSWVTTVVICLSLIAPYSCKKVSAMTVLETDVTVASDGCTLLGVYGSYYSQAQEALDRINEIRKEACDAGNVPDPRNTSRMLSAADYVPIKWSTDLESIARIRAMEGGLAYGFMASGHNRLNGKDTFSVKYNGVSSYAEDLAYNWGTSMVSGINQWYAEKSDWVNQVSGTVTGHYTSMINPNYTYVGLGDFYTEEAAYPNTLAGEFCSSSQNLDQTMQPAQTDVMQKIEVKDSYITGYVLEGVDTIYTDKTTTLTPKASLINGSNTHKLWILDSVTYTSSDTSVATVTDAGVVTGIKNGTTTITVKSGETTLASTDITVKCDHAKEFVSETQPTCTTAGVKVYRCEICGTSIEQEIPKIPHDYIYGDADSSGYRTGVCSGCGDSITIIPPTTYTVWWRDSASTSDYYYSSFPSSSSVGSTIYCWLKDVDGDSSYRDMVMTSTDESVVSVPDTAIANSAFNTLNILGSGITTLTIYPKYNPSLTKKYVVRIGSSGSVDITTADVALSQTFYEYSGNECTPSVSVSYHDTVLTKGTDYSVTYENNKAAGTATVVITGDGIFTGSIRKNFTISAGEHSEHVYGEWQVVTQASCTKAGEKRRYCSICGDYETEVIEKLEHTSVTDAAVPATCTETGLTAGSHCSVCGSIIVAQSETEPTGHNYVDGICQNCGDILYVNYNGLRYTILDKNEGSGTVSVAAQEGQTLEGEVNIPSIIEINGVDYSVTTVEENAFAGQD